MAFNRLRLVTPVLMWAIVIAGIAMVLLFVPHRWLFRRSPMYIVLFGLSLINWLYFFVSAALTNRTPARSAAGIEKLATTGVYAKVRHPIYSADIILAWGIFLLVPTLRVVFSSAWLTAVLAVWMVLEEQAMVQRFGEQYVAYMRRTPRFVPRYFGR